MTRPADPLAVGVSLAHSLRWFRWLTALSAIPALTRTDLVVALKLAERADPASGRVELDGWRPTKRAISQQLFGLGPSAIGNAYTRLKAAGVIVEVQSSTSDGQPPFFRLVDDWRGSDAGQPHRWDLAGVEVALAVQREGGTVEEGTPRCPTADPSLTALSHVPGARPKGPTARRPRRSAHPPVVSSPGVQATLFPEELQ